VKRIGLLNEAETEYFEKMLSENSLKAHVDFKQCPKCRSFIERLNDSNLRVKCTICTKIMGRNYEFCWQCEREWDSASSMTCNEKDSCGKQGNFEIRLLNEKFLLKIFTFLRKQIATFKKTLTFYLNVIQLI